MIQLDGTEVVSAVAYKLRTVFPEKEIPNIYKDTPLQNMIKPCFFIQVVSDSYDTFRRRGCLNSKIIDVRFHPEDNCTNRETLFTQISMRMLDALDYIMVSGQKVISSKLNCQSVDGVLHCIVTYRFNITKMNEDASPMNTLKHKEGVK
jgi:hypothetical protein